MRLILSLFTILALLIGGVFWATRNKQSVAKAEPVEKPAAEITLLLEETKELPAVAFLTSHGQAGHSPLQDVKLIHNFVGMAAMENRHLDTFYLSTNPDLTEIILGKEGKSHPMLPRDHHTLGENQYGELTLLDRWKVPYRLHMVDRNRIEIFSAGPDKVPGTDDDLSWPPKEQLYLSEAP